MGSPTFKTTFIKNKHYQTRIHSHTKPYTVTLSVSWYVFFCSSSSDLLRILDIWSGTSDTKRAFTGRSMPCACIWPKSEKLQLRGHVCTQIRKPRYQVGLLCVSRCYQPGLCRGHHRLPWHCLLPRAYTRQLLFRTRCIWDGTDTVPGMHLRQYHPLPRSGAPVTRCASVTLPPVWLSSHDFRATLWPILVSPCRFLFFQGGLHKLETPTFSLIDLSGGVPELTTYHLFQTQVEMSNLKICGTHFESSEKQICDSEKKCRSVQCVPHQFDNTMLSWMHSE